MRRVSILCREIGEVQRCLAAAQALQIGDYRRDRHARRGLEYLQVGVRDLPRIERGEQIALDQVRTAPGTRSGGARNKDSRKASAQEAAMTPPAQRNALGKTEEKMLAACRELI